nr:uncharacterized protein LOC111420220 [Onthophagus taurus]
MGGKKNKQKKRAAANQAANQPGNVRPGTSSRPTQSRSEARLQVPFFPIRPARPVQFPLRNQRFMQSVPRLVFPQRAQQPLIQLQRPYQQTVMVQRPQFVLQPRPQPPFGSHPSHNFTFLPNPYK